MADRLQAATAVLIWVVVLWRLHTSRVAGPPRILWLGLTTLACGQSLQVLAWYRALEHLLHVPGGAAGAKHAIATLSAASVRALVGALAGERLPRWKRTALPVAVLALIIGPVLLWPPQVLPAALHDRAEFYGPGLGVVVPWAAFLGYLSWALGSAVKLCWRYQRHAPTWSLRRGLQILAVGEALGFGYVALKILIEGAWVTGRGEHLVHLDAILEAVILGVVVTACAVGSTFEALADRLGGLVGAATAARALHRLRPLQEALREVAPHIVRLPASRSWWPRDLRMRRRVRLVEIQDGLLYLQAFLPASARPAAAAAAVDLRLSGPRAAAAAEAGWIEAARRAQRAGAPAHPRLPVPYGVGQPDDAEWLETVSSALGDTAVTNAIADSLVTDRTSARGTT